MIRFLQGLVAAGCIAIAGTLGAQGSLGAQGLGYPVGGLSGAAASLAGASAELDANSAVNPAAVTRTTRFSIMFRFEPEMRETKVGDQRAYANVVRFPGFQFTGAYGRFVGAVGLTPLLDRSWSNSVTDTLIVSGLPLQSQLKTSSEGSMNDARLAIGYIVSPRLQFGAAVHAITGENRTSFSRTFADTSAVQGVSQENAYGFSGSAVSFGVVAEVVRNLVVSASAKIGGEVAMDRQGDEVATADVPSRAGIGVAYFGIRGVSAHLRVDRARWSDLDGLSASASGLFDATEIAAGVEALGPSVRGTNALLRAGYRTRTLPYAVNGDRVDERGLAFGVGFPLARGRTQIDLGAQRLTRSAPGASENSWLFTVGLGIRP